MFAKLGKLVDKASEAVNEKKNEVLHKVNAKRDFSSTRDLQTEVQELRSNTLKYHEQTRDAVSAIIGFAIVNHGLSSAIHAQITSPLQSSMSALQPILDQLSQAAFVLDGYIQEEGAARKAAPNQGKPLQPVENGPEEDMQFTATRLAIRHAKLRDFTTKFLAALDSLHTLLFNAMDATYKAADAALPKTCPRQTVPWEQLWDEFRPATGASASKPPGNVAASDPSVNSGKPTPADELAAFVRPTDGDVRAKYAKQWDLLVAGVIETAREQQQRTDKLVGRVKKVLEYASVWVQSDMSGLPAIEKTTKFFGIYATQFDTKHLPEFHANYENFVKKLEGHSAYVPTPNITPPTTEAHLEIPRRRTGDVREAILAAFSALATFYGRSVSEVKMFGPALLNAIGEPGR
eukprot:ANDGO_04240.mRNA.1 hypothetical protein